MEGQIDGPSREGDRSALDALARRDEKAAIRLPAHPHARPSRHAEGYGRDHDKAGKDEQTATSSDWFSAFDHNPLPSRLVGKADKHRARFVVPCLRGGGKGFTIHGHSSRLASWCSSDVVRGSRPFNSNRFLPAIQG